MPEAVIATVYQRVRIDGVRDVEVTSVVDDGAGGFLRAIKVFGDSSSESQNQLVFEVVIQSENPTDLKITTPEIDF